MDKIFDMVDEMLKHSEKLTNNELDWVKKIDRTTAGFRNTDFTTRQREVLNDIYNKFKERM